MMEVDIIDNHIYEGDLEQDEYTYMHTSGMMSERVWQRSQAGHVLSIFLQRKTENADYACGIG